MFARADNSRDVPLFVARLLEGTFEGLDSLEELRLVGFEALKTIAENLFVPLRNLKSLLFDGFGQSHLTFADFSLALTALSGTPLRHVALKKHPLNRQPREDARRRPNVSYIQRHSGIVRVCREQRHCGEWTTFGSPSASEEPARLCADADYGDGKVLFRLDSAS